MYLDLAQLTLSFRIDRKGKRNFQCVKSSAHNWGIQLLSSIPKFNSTRGKVWTTRAPTSSTILKRMNGGTNRAVWEWKLCECICILYDLRRRWVPNLRKLSELCFDNFGSFSSPPTWVAWLGQYRWMIFGWYLFIHPYASTGSGLEGADYGAHPSWIKASSSILLKIRSLGRLIWVSNILFGVQTAQFLDKSLP